MHIEREHVEFTLLIIYCWNFFLIKRSVMANFRLIYRLILMLKCYLFNINTVCDEGGVKRLFEGFTLFNVILF